MPALICGSLAFDTIATFPGRFADQILPDHIHILNTSFLVPSLRREYGGCAGNIAYSLKKLGGEPLPMAMLGALLLCFGWLGFNGGSTLAFDHRVPGVLVHTTLAGVAGCTTGLLLARFWRGYHETMYLVNGLIAGLVAITASAHVVSALEAVLIGAVGALLMAWVNEKLLDWRIDDAVGAIPAHLVAGIWGTLAVGLFGDLNALGTGHDRWGQIGVQLLGIVVCGVWCSLCAWLFLRFLTPHNWLRVTPEDERTGLNVAEHGARTELIDLLEAMENQRQSGDLSHRVPAETFTEVGQVAQAYNQVIEALEQATNQTRAIVRDMRDGKLADGAAVLRAIVRAESERLVPQATVRDLALAA